MADRPASIRLAQAPEHVISGGRRVNYGWWVHWKGQEYLVRHEDLGWPRPDGESWAETMRVVQQLGIAQIERSLADAQTIHAEASHDGRTPTAGDPDLP